MTLIDVYNARVAAGEVKADAGQAAIIAKLSRLEHGFEAATVDRESGLIARWFRQPATSAPSGIYIHGEVGRGKTMLMDMFCSNARIEPKRRVHFHAFMQDVHARLHAARRKTRDAIAPVAASIAAEAKLLCLDEMQVGDIADAMIVGRLFEALLAKGTVVVTTSNAAPDGLYRDGLNRQLFLPFITLLREKLDVVALEGGTDYRLGRVKGHETFITPLNPAADDKVQELWRRLTDTEQGKTMEIDVLGRKLGVPQAAHACARFSFAELCEAPLGPPDYLSIARNFRTVFVEHIPALGPAQRNEAKRFVTLIDTLYDAQVRLVASSANAPERIYPAGDHRFEFSRTVSRLREMQSASWWGKKIVET
ncbi:MAG: cell division protein ZapE [Rhizobiales bacterium]|nr:cell division protein ZapE [Hyphomicrobiales bacterium]